VTFGRPRKPPGITAKRRAAKSRKLKAAESAHKAEARARDGAGGDELTGRCRFPLCGCAGRAPLGSSRLDGKGFYWIEVSHYVKHKGMGGDPTGARSHAKDLICLCNWRHKEGQFAIDHKNLRAVPLTDQGANGPVAWEMYLPESGWFELARELAVQVLEPAPACLPILQDLAKMRT